MSKQDQFFKRFSYPSFCSTYILGALVSLAFAPLNFSFFLILSFTGLFKIIKDKSVKETFIYSWLFGLGHFSTSLYWIYYAFEIVELNYLGPFAVIGLSIYLAIFPALAAALTTLWSQTAIQRVWLFSALWSLMEWLRSFLLTGFPWNLIGYTWDIEILQSVAWIGIYGLSFLTIFFATSFSTRSWKMIVSSTFIMCMLWAGGYLRLQSNSTLEYENLNIRLIQASVPQKQKWLAEERERNLQLYLGLSELEAEKPLKAVIWTEAAVTYPINHYKNIRDILKTIVPKNGVLITGGIRLLNPEKSPPTLFNTLFVLDHYGEILESYDKKQLTPFGEYIPFKNFLPIEKLTFGSIDYQCGTEPKVLQTNAVPPFQPLICYEGIFPHLILGRNANASWFLSLTNDSWFGQSWGPHQHLAIVRARAIEHGLPLVRAASNGISAVIDPLGRILNRLELNQIGFIDFVLPRPLEHSTFYSQWREIPFLVLIGFSLIIGLVNCLKRKALHG